MCAPHKKWSHNFKCLSDFLALVTTYATIGLLLIGLDSHVDSILTRHSADVNEENAAICLF